MNRRTGPSWLRIFAICGGLTIINCQPPLAHQRAPFKLKDESGETLQRLPRVARLRLTGAPNIHLEDYWWIEGDVSSTSSKKLRQRGIPETVEKHRLPLSVWTDTNDVILAPAQPLEAGERYTLVALGVGTIAELAAAAEEQQLWFRWGRGAVNVGDEIPFCEWKTLPFVGLDAGSGSDFFTESALGGAAGHAGREEQSFDSIRFGLTGSFFEASCVRISVTANAYEAFVPPAQVLDVNLDPTPIPIAPLQGEEAIPSNIATASSSAACVSMANTTICAQGAGFVIDPARGKSALEFWLKDELIGRVVQDENALNPITFGPVEPSAEYELRGLRFSRAGLAEGELSIARLRTGAPSPHFVLTEVMTDPSGLEPQGEWVELANIGALGGSLLGYQLWDEAGGVSLPDVRLAPGQYGLIVRRDFSIERGLVPDALALPLQVESLGKNGLRNSGERVELRDASGELLSSIPAISGTEGVSIARLTPWAADAPDSFRPHGDPGASPGSVNHFDDVEP